MHTAILNHINSYVNLDKQEEELLILTLQQLHLKKKEFVLREGKVCTGNYFISKGCLRMFFYNDKGMEQTIQFAIENWWISDYNSMERIKPSEFNIQAVEASEVIVFEKKDEETLFTRIPKLERYFRLVLTRAYGATQMRTKYNQSLSREEQYHHFCTLFPDFIQRIPQYMLASFLGFSPEFLSKIRARKPKKIS